nr:reverse transcriptase [Tanacetum cinerariifolium]
MQEATLAIPKNMYTHLLYTPKNVVTPFVPKSRGYGAKGNTFALPAIPQTIGSNEDGVISKQEPAPDNEVEEETMPQVSPNAMNMPLRENTQSKLQIQTLLDEFTIIFTEPKGLPPNSSHDHNIPLAPNAPPINIRPYKHPLVQKDAIELMVKELLEARTIKNNQSSFSTPIVMVKKKDRT